VIAADLATHHGTARTADEEEQASMNRLHRQLPDKPPPALPAGALFEL
jgi:hypothetical protein